jgi:hypothetical protein
MPIFQRATRRALGPSVVNALIRPCDVKSYRDSHPGVCEKPGLFPSVEKKAVQTGELVVPTKAKYKICPFCGRPMP